MKESELLFTEILNCNKLSLYLNRELPLGRDKSVLISSVLKRRITGEPIQYILGKTEFMGLEFRINRNVFIPRPETEILVETVLEYVTKPPLRLRSGQGSHQATSIMDIGTGSGCIAVSLAKFLSDVTITATDVSEKAIDKAQDNALLNDVADKIRFIHSDLFTSCKLQAASYDVIISNPPYIPSAEIKNLSLEIQYEPLIALDGGRDGLDFYGKIINESSRYLKETGLLIMEMGCNQRGSVEDIFKKSGSFKVVNVVKDYNDIDRVIVTQKQVNNG